MQLLPTVIAHHFTCVDTVKFCPPWLVVPCIWCRDFSLSRQLVIPRLLYWIQGHFISCVHLYSFELSWVCLYLTTTKFHTYQVHRNTSSLRVAAIVPYFHLLGFHPSDWLSHIPGYYWVSSCFWTEDTLAWIDSVSTCHYWSSLYFGHIFEQKKQLVCNLLLSLLIQQS